MPTVSVECVTVMKKSTLHSRIVTPTQEILESGVGLMHTLKSELEPEPDPELQGVGNGALAMLART